MAKNTEPKNAIGTAEIGPTFGAELIAANLAGLPFAWGADGSFQWDERLSEEDRALVLEVYGLHDPSKPSE